MCSSDLRIARAHFAFGRDFNTKFFGGMGLTMQDGTPKPIYNTFKMYNMLPKRRVVATSNAEDAGVGGIAARSDKEVCAIVWWYLPKTWAHEGMRRVKVAFTNLPSAGDYRLTRYVIDSAHSNYRAGKEHARLEAVESATVQCPNAQYEKTLDVELNSVALLKLEAAE